MTAYQVTQIEIDWQDEWDHVDPISPGTRAEITEELLGSIWEADDGDDLIDEITTAIGWCILSIDYRTVLHSIP
jgi:hypothetical protein